MSKLLVNNPASAGQVVASYNASSVNDTDWHTLSSDEFYDTITGTQLADGLQFAFVNVTSSSTSALTHLKLRAAGGAGDGKTNTDGILSILGQFSVDAQALSGGADVTSIAYAKGAGGDTVVITAGFNR